MTPRIASSPVAWLFEQPFHWYQQAARHWPFWLGVPIVLYSWTLSGPFLSDDLHLILKAERYIRDESDSLDLYRFTRSEADWQRMRDRGFCPWWTASDGQLDFFRPITELSFYLDVLLFGRNPLGYRLVSLGVFVIALICVYRLFMAVGGDAVRAGTAAYFYGISQTVTPPVTWMCNRQDLLVVIGVSVAATAYWESSRRPGIKHLFVALPAFGFALLSKEVGVALAGVVGVHELLVRRRTDVRPGRRVAGGIAVALALMAAGYLAYYLYSRPWAFFITSDVDGGRSQLSSQLPRSLLLYAAVWTIGFPIDMLHVATDVQVWLVAGIGGALMLGTAIFMRRSARGHGAALFFVLWTLLFIIPGLRSLTASTRTLCTASVGWSYLLVGLFFAKRAEKQVVPLPVRAWLNAANGVISAGCAIGTVIFMNATENGARERMQQALASLPSPLQDGDTLIFDRAKSMFEMICAGDRLEFLTGRRDVSALFLVGPGIEASLSPKDDHTIVARAETGGLFDSPIHHITLDPGWLPRVGDRFEVRSFVAEITRVGAGNSVQGMRFQFREPLNSPELHFSPPELALGAKAGGTDRHGVSP